MASIALDLPSCVVLAVDLQESLLNSVEDGKRVTSRCEYLLRVATALNIPILATTQNRAKLGPLAPSIAALVDSSLDKSRFSCWRDDDIRTYLWNMSLKQVILCGVETHICISLTALDLLSNGYQVCVCPDAVGASNLECHKLGMERMRDAGIIPIHTEAIAYELLNTSTHPAFREILKITKEFR